MDLKKDIPFPQQIQQNCGAPRAESVVPDRRPREATSPACVGTEAGGLSDAGVKPSAIWKLFAFHLLFPSKEEGPKPLRGPRGEVKKMYSRRNRFVKEVRVHLFDLFVKKPVALAISMMGRG